MKGQVAYHTKPGGQHLSTDGNPMRKTIEKGDEKLFLYVLNGEVRTATTRMSLGRESDLDVHQVGLENVR